MTILEDVGELEEHTFGQFRDIIYKAAHDTGLRMMTGWNSQGGGGGVGGMGPDACASLSDPASVGAEHFRELGKFVDICNAVRCKWETLRESGRLSSQDTPLGNCFYMDGAVIGIGTPAEFPGRDVSVSTPVEQHSTESGEEDEMAIEPVEAKGGDCHAEHLTQSSRLGTRASGEALWHHGKNSRGKMWFETMGQTRARRQRFPMRLYPIMMNLLEDVESVGYAFDNLHGEASHACAAVNTRGGK